MCEYYGVDIERIEYIDDTRSRRVKDVCFGIYFNVKRKKFTLKEILEMLKTLDIESVTLKYSNGIRILVRVKNEHDNIRVYFNGTNDECLDFVKELTDNIIISPSFDVKVYKYQDKLDRVLNDKDNITSLVSKEYFNNARQSYTYAIRIHGLKNERYQLIHSITFGGRNIKIKDSYETALEFINKIKLGMDKSIKYSISVPDIETNEVGNR